MSFELGREVAQLEAQLLSNRAQHTKALDEFRGRLKRLQNAGDVSHKESTADLATKRASQSGAKADISGAEAEAHNAASQVLHEREKLRDLRKRLMSRVQAAATCRGCEELAAFQIDGSAGTSVVLSLKSRPNSAAGNIADHYKLVHHVEALEQRRDRLRTELSQEMRAYVKAQQALLKSIDTMGMKVSHRVMADSKSQEESRSKEGRLEHERGVVQRYRDHHLGELERVRAEVAALESRLDEVEAVLRKCGC